MERIPWIDGLPAGLTDQVICLCARKGMMRLTCTSYWSQHTYIAQGLGVTANVSSSCTTTKLTHQSTSAFKVPIMDGYWNIKGVTLDCIYAPKDVRLYEKFDIKLRHNYLRKNKSETIVCVRVIPGLIPGLIPGHDGKPLDDDDMAEGPGTWYMPLDNGELTFTFVHEFRSTGAGNPPEATFDVEFELWINGCAKAFERVAITVRK